MNIEVKIDKELIPYNRAIKTLQNRVDSIKKGKDADLLWILEHPTTFTAGIRSNKKDILDKKIKIINTNRGGKITLHSPGQKIIYFVIDLNKRKRDIRKLITQIEKSIVDFLSIYRINAVADRKNIGVWVKGKKIAAIGIKVSKWIAYHGCSINISNDLNKYKKIVPCGLDNKKVTSVYQENKKIIKNVNNNLKDIFLRNINKI